MQQKSSSRNSSYEYLYKDYLVNYHKHLELFLCLLYMTMSKRRLSLISWAMQKVNSRSEQQSKNETRTHFFGPVPQNSSSLSPVSVPMLVCVSLTPHLWGGNSVNMHTSLCLSSFFCPLVLPILQHHNYHKIYSFPPS